MAHNISIDDRLSLLMDASQNQAQVKAQQEKEKQEEQRQQVLDKIFTAEAKERLNRVRLVKPEKVRQVEDLVIQMAQQNRLGGPIQDAQLCDLLARASEGGTGEVKIAHRGKKGEDAWDDDDDGW